MIRANQLRVLYGNVGSAFDQHASSCSAMPVYHSLHQHIEMIGSLDAAPHGMEHLFHTIGAFHPSYKRWKERRHKSMWTFDYQSMLAAKRVRKFKDEYDVYFQQRALFDPRWVTEKPYVIYTDATHAMTCRYWPDWSPFTTQELQAWLDTEKGIYERAAMIFTWSDMCMNSVIQDYDQSPEKVHAVGCGVNFTDAPEHGDYSNKTLLFCGYDFERKGGPLLLKAFDQLQAYMPGVKLLVVGPAKQTVQLPEGVTWIGPLKNRAHLSRLMSKASLFVMPTHYDPVGSVYLEAMLHELPVIASDRCGYRNVIAESKAGIVVSPDRPEELSDQLYDLLRVPHRLAKMGQAGKQFAQKHCNWDQTATLMAEHMKAAWL